MPDMQPVPSSFGGHIEVDTPRGKLSVTFPQGRLIYADSLDPVGYEPPMDPTPYCTLDGTEITHDEAKRIVAAMRRERNR